MYYFYEKLCYRIGKNFEMCTGNKLPVHGYKQQVILLKCVLILLLATFLLHRLSNKTCFMIIVHCTFTERVKPT